MPLNLAAKVEQTKKDMICLKYTKLIQAEDLKLPAWLLLNDEYLALQEADSCVKAVLTILNSVIYQHRVVFCITRNSLRILLKQDKNWKTPPGFRNGHYKKILKHLFEYVREVKNPKGRGDSVLVCQVIDKELLSFLQVDVDKQMAEAIAFISRDQSGDQLGDVGARTKELVVSSEKEEDRTVPSRISSKEHRETAERLEKLIHSPGVPAGTLKMLQRWQKDYPNGLSLNQMRSLDELEQKYLVTDPETGEKITATDALMLLDAFIKNHFDLDEGEIREEFTRKVGQVTADAAFRECELSGIDIPWLIGRHQKYKDPGDAQPIYRNPVPDDNLTRQLKKAESQGLEATNKILADLARPGSPAKNGLYELWDEVDSMNKKLFLSKFASIRQELKKLYSEIESCNCDELRLKLLRNYIEKFEAVDSGSIPAQAAQKKCGQEVQNRRRASEEAP